VRRRIAGHRAAVREADGCRECSPVGEEEQAEGRVSET